MLTALSRVFSSGVQTFRRNAWLSLATIGVLALMLFVFSILMVFSFLTKQVVATIQDKIDVSIYFDISADEAEILRARDLLQLLPEVARVEYVSRDDALTKFRERHKANEVLVQALEELGTNPLQPSLNIKARQAEQYAAIIAFIDNAPFKKQIAKVNFVENQIVIERLTRVIRAVKRSGTALSIILAIIASLIVFNTVRMAIYSFREEISIMKLVGASNWFARGPFIVMGLLVSLIASVIALAVFYPLMVAASPRVEAFIPGTDLIGFVNGNLLKIFLLQMFAGIILGTLSTTIAINKYLKV